MKVEEEQKLKEKRGEIVTHFAYIESLLKKYISFYYFKTAYHPIVPDIFEDEYFSFGLLLKVFEKIVSKQGVKFSINKLRRLGQLRNVVAHALVEAKASGFSKEEITKIYFKHGGEEKEIKEIFYEYDSIKIEIQESLKELLRPGLDIQQVPECKN